MDEKIIEQINDLLHRPEFIPFKMTLAGGESYAVHNPSLIVVGKASIFYCFPDDRFAIIRTSQITSLQTLAAA